MLGRVSLFKNTCFKVKFKNITFLVLICVKVGESGVYSEGLTHTTCFGKVARVFLHRSTFMRLTKKKKTNALRNLEIRSLNYFS